MDVHVDLELHRELGSDSREVFSEGWDKALTLADYMARGISSTHQLVIHLEFTMGLVFMATETELVFWSS